MGDARLSLARLVLLQAAAAGSPPSAQAPAPSAEVASPSTGGAAALPLQQPSRMPMPGRAHSAQTAQPPLPPFSSSPGWRGSPAWLDGSSAQTPAAKGGGSPRESVPLAKKRKRSAVDGGDGGEDAGGWAGEGRANEEDGDRVSEGVDEGDEAEGVYAVRSILKKRFDPAGRVSYLVEWEPLRGSSICQTSWEPSENVRTCPKLVNKFEAAWGRKELERFRKIHSRS